MSQTSAQLAENAETVLPTPDLYARSEASRLDAHGHVRDTPAPHPAGEQRAGKLSAPQDSPTKEAEYSGYLSACLSHWAHLDTTMWSRVQSLAAVQAGALGAAYGLRQDNALAGAVLLLAVTLTATLWFMMQRDAHIRDCNLDLMKSLAKRLSNQAFGEGSPMLEFNPEPAGRAPFRGRDLNTFTFTLFVVCDLLVFLLVVV